ncbi:hypothetical protein [Streptomyces collinus]|uniref:DUF6197 family protein n=1 Tax=Streptomyces collinus TaxID=42684 RepID=UPI0036B5BDEE
MTTLIPAQTTTTPAARFTDITLSEAGKLAADRYQPWTGPSGEETTGEAVALHLEAAIRLLEQDGWVRVYDYSKEWSAGSDLPDEDTASSEEMLRALLRLVRDEAGTGPQRTLSTVLRHVGGSSHGDPDTAQIASAVLDLVIRAHTGCGTARASCWSERLTRTHQDITALLTAGALFARTYGPSA